MNTNAHEWKNNHHGKAARMERGQRAESGTD